MAVKLKVLAFANKVSNKKPGAKNAFTEKDPEYKILEPVVTDEMAEAALALDFRVHKTAAEIAKLCGKPVERTTELLMELADAGVCFVNANADGVDEFWYDTWVPGIMEMMANNLENVRKHPQIAESFEEYGRLRGAKTAGMLPVGVGLMRVIPIESAIDGESRRASYEEVSKYLHDNSIFSVSDCACRTVRESMGEGCGHLKEDMCIQMGHAAEYYIRTGRGREITREEAFEIIHRAEENGLMHQIPNLDGSGKTHAICNCCGCSCLSLRTASMFLNVDMVRSNYVATVDTKNCVACGECVENCPVNALRLGQKLCSSKPVVMDITTTVTPRDTEWTADKWNPEYRTNRQNVVETGTSPCKTNCPAHIGVQGYIKLAAMGRYTEALELIKKNNPFPAVCGRICPRLCESACTRGNIDEPVAVDEIKKFIAAQDLDKDRHFVPEKRHDYGKKIAVIGAGPSGLSCAYYLAIDGYKVTVFEKERRLGGMLTLGIPAFRLEKDVVEAEIAILGEMGVEFRTGVDVGKDVSLEALREQGFEAFYLAVGAQGGRKLGIPGEDAADVHTGVDFLRRINLGEDVRLSGDVVVIGGGNVAIDVARSATRVSDGSVTMLCPESRAEMPALDEEIVEAEEEHVAIRNGWGPARILTENDRVTGVEFKKCVSVFNAEKRFAPVYDENDTMIVPASHVLVSVGQSIEWGVMLEGSAVELNPNRTVKTDPRTLQTAQKDVFVGGDAFTGPRFAIDAIAHGKEAAVSIHRFVQRGQDLLIGRDRREYTALDTASVQLEGYDTQSRQRPAVAQDPALHKEFRDVRFAFTEEQMRKETERCLGCGATIVDQYLCVGCGQCTTKCKFDAIKLERRYDGEGVSYEKLKPTVIKHVVKRKVRMTTKKIKNALSGKNH